MIDKKTFKKTFDEPFGGVGCIKKGQSWYLDGQDNLIVVNLQKCDWNETYFINIGIWLKVFGKHQFPQHNQCHLDFRVEELFPQQRKLILTSCSLDEGNEPLLRNLSEFLNLQLIPFLQDCTREAYLRELMSQGKLERGAILSYVRDYLTTT